MDVRVIDVTAWKGPRHERLRRIWRTVKRYEHWCDGSHVELFRNDRGLTHAECLQEIWDQGKNGYGDVDRAVWCSALVITELDFLPNLRDDWVNEFNDTWPDDVPVFAPKRQRAHAGHPEVWFIGLDRAVLGGRDIRWHHDIDPGFDLDEQIPELQMYEGRLGTGKDGDHLGWEYPWGVHLLGSRHLHDPPETPLWEHEGRMLTAGELQANHDQYVERWLAGQSSMFRGWYESC